MPEAAERALVSPATAYRYFPTADDLWEEASLEAIDFERASRRLDELGSTAAPRWNAMIVEPLRGRLDELIAALGVGWGTGAAIALVDVAGLHEETAKQTMLRTCHRAIAIAITDRRHADHS